MSHRTRPRRMTEAEYLAFEENSLEKHEFVNGELVAMSLLFVDSKERRIQRQDRNADGTWTLVDITDGELQLLGVSVPVDEIYAGVVFEEGGHGGPPHA